MTEAVVNVEQQKEDTQVSKNVVKDQLEKLNERFGHLDYFMCFDVFYLMMTWFFLIGQKDSEVVFAANSFTWYVSLVFLLDLMFRLLSYKIESMNPGQWNHLWLCLFPVVFTMLAALYDYEYAVYGSKPLQVWNALFYTFYMVGVIVCGVYHFMINRK